MQALRCDPCNGHGTVAMAPFCLLFLGEAWQTERSRRFGGSVGAIEPCRSCDGNGSRTMPDVFDWAYPIDWAIAAGKASGMVVRGIVWSYDGPGLGGKPYAYNRYGRKLLRALPDRLAYRAGGAA